MVLQLASEEPEGGPWRAKPVKEVVKALFRLGGGRAAADGSHAEPSASGTARCTVEQHTRDV